VFEAEPQWDRLRTPRTENYLHEYAFEELKAFIEEIFSPDQRIILVGHSDGGTIALLYASKIPGKIAGIITMAAHVINEPETIAGIKPAVDAYENGKLQKLNDFHGDKTEALFYAWANTWNLEAFKTWNICQDINGIQSPTLVLQGEKDQYGSTRQMELIKESITADCELKLIQKAAHIPHLENKGVVINTIQTWVQKQKNILYL
jgi:pimeloyl-ACP methyl ester carboxylesterase